MKYEIFERLQNEFNEKDCIGETDVKQLKAKIKSIQDVYRQEINKIGKNKKSGCGTEELYSQ